MPRALIVSGGFKGHQPEVIAERYDDLLTSAGWTIDHADNLAAFGDADRLAEADVVIPNWTMGALERHEWQPLQEAIASGTGFAGCHGGMGDAMRGHTGWQWVTGGIFVGHPGGNQLQYTVTPSSDDPIVAGLHPFTLKSEQYYLLVDPAVEILATTTVSDEQPMPWLAGTDMPVAWKRPWDQGRVFYCAIGHFPEEFDIPQFRNMMLRGITWAARQPVSAEA